MYVCLLNPELIEKQKNLKKNLGQNKSNVYCYCIYIFIKIIRVKVDSFVSTLDFIDAL